MSAMDILAKLDGLDVHSLESFQRILLVTDGTLTEILEAMFFERIRLVKVSQTVIPATASHALLEPIPGEPLLKRRILLQGVRSCRNYVYAESLIAVDRLGQSFRDELLDSGIPLGRLWLDHRLETFKELQEVRCLRAEKLAHYFECDEAESFLARIYRVFSRERPVMVITEQFPAVYRKSVQKANGQLNVAGAGR
jgi:chorismate-pyruvate lyase